MFFQGFIQKNVNSKRREFQITHHEFFEKCLLKAPWCIVNGGLTLIECLYLKKPVFAFPQNAYEKNLLQCFMIKGIY